MDKITEEVITALIRRIEKLEEEVYKTKKQNPPIYNSNTSRPGMATEGQLNFIKGLGGHPWPDMTKYEASKEINKLKAIKDKKSESKSDVNVATERGSPSPSEPAELSGTFDSEPLSKEEIEEIGEENLL